MVDAHVHLHDRFDAICLLDSARANFERYRPPSLASRAMLVLTEVEGADHFQRLREVGGDGRWSIGPSTEKESLTARYGEVEAIDLVAGRQIATAEGLEVLALGRRIPCPDGEPLDEVVAEVGRSGAAAMIPWGFGKWWFERRRLLARLLERADPRWFFLGDSGGRLRHARTPQLFRRARDRGIRILAGTDPLPLPGQLRRVASFGFACSVDGFAPASPAASLRALLREESVRPRTYGERTGLVPFLGAQLAMQWVKRQRKRPG